MYECRHDGHIILEELKLADSAPALPEEPKKDENGIRLPPERPIFTITKDGIYIFQLTINQLEGKAFSANVHVEMKAPYGYLSASDWPLLLVRKCGDIPTDNFI